MEKLKIYGERNSGTNFLTRLIRRNFHCEIIPGTLAEARPGYRESFELELERKISDAGKRILARQIKLDDFFRGNLWATLGWKHCVPPVDVIRSHPDRNNTLFVTIIKNPYSWLLSLFRRPYENTALERTADLGKFISEPWLAGDRENTPPYLESPVELWNLKTSGYMQLARTVESVNIRYEELLADPVSALKSLQGCLERRTRKFELAIESTKSADVGQKDFDYYRDYYLNERWKQDLGHDHIKMINSYLDPDIVEKSGYRLLVP